MLTTAFARDLAERVIATFAQALAAMFVANGTGLLEADWVTSLSVAGMTALVSLLKGVAAGAVDSETGASLLPDPPPKVGRDDAGRTDLLYVLAVVLVVVLIVAIVL